MTEKNRSFLSAKPIIIGVPLVSGEIYLLQANFMSNLMKKGKIISLGKPFRQLLIGYFVPPRNSESER